jgi:protein gp37
LLSWHTYQLLTKRSERLLELSGDLPWPVNVWMGVTVESEAYRFRVDHLRRTGAQCRFLSLEPLLGPLPNLDLSGIHWVIVGGESGPGARPLQENWVLDIRDQCAATQAPVHAAARSRASVSRSTRRAPAARAALRAASVNPARAKKA